MLFQFQKTLNIILVSITKLVTLKFRKIFSYLDTSYTAAQSVFLCFSSQSCETWGHVLGCRWMSMLMERKGIFSRWQSNFFLSYMVSRDLFQWSVYFSCVFVGWGLIFFFPSSCVVIINFTADYWNHLLWLCIYISSKSY